jgi:hypothetical protein
MWRRRCSKLLLPGVVATLALLSLATASASSPNISHSYQAAKGVNNGSLVSLDPSRSGFVEPANTANDGQLLGVAVATNDSLVAIDPGPGQVQIATSGGATALVSTLNGDIHVGDAVGVSPFGGIGMKALLGSRVIGLALAPFNAQTPGATTQQVTNKRGKTTAVKVGYARVNIAIGVNASALSTSNLNTLQQAVKTLTGHTVATSRITISLVVALVAIIALITLVYASIYGSIVSVGRNPLAKYAVFRTLGSVLGLAVLTTVIAGLLIFFLLR